MDTNVVKPKDWINRLDRVPFCYDCQIEPRRIYFLYSFLGDGFAITQQEYLDNLEKWRNMHLDTDWNVSILRNRHDDLASIVKEHFSWFWLTYSGYPKNIQRCDTLRYMLLYQYGGVYSDLDVSPSIPIPALFRKYPWANVIFGVARKKPLEKCRLTTKKETCRKGEVEIPTRLSNYFMAAKIPYHPIWIDILRLAKSRSNVQLSSQYGIIYTTGPDVVTTAVSKNRGKYTDIAIVPIEEFQQMYSHSCTSFNDKKSWRQRCQLPTGEGGVDTV
jgi:mannosyltransferase OCH1-like enzyme